METPKFGADTDSVKQPRSVRELLWQADQQWTALNDEGIGALYSDRAGGPTLHEDFLKTVRDRAALLIALPVLADELSKSGVEVPEALQARLEGWGLRAQKVLDEGREDLSAGFEVISIIGEAPHALRELAPPSEA